MIPEGKEEVGRPALKAGRAYLTVQITRKDGTKQIVECEADMSEPRMIVNESPEPQKG